MFFASLVSNLHHRAQHNYTSNYTNRAIILPEADPDWGKILLTTHLQHYELLTPTVLR